MALRRGAGLVLALIGMAVVVSIAGFLAVYLLVSREPTVPGDATLVMRIRGDLPETEPPGLVAQLLVSPPTVRSVVDNLRKAKVDDRIQHVLLIPRDTQTLWVMSKVGR